MIAAARPIQRPPDARLLAIDADGTLRHAPRAEWPRLLERDDLVVANDAATLPASLAGVHVRTGAVIEARLAQRASLDPHDVLEWVAVVFGAGDHRTRTEDRPAPPELRAGDALRLGPLRAVVLRTLGHPRLVALRFEATIDDIWAGLASHGRPIQYAHLQPALALWDVWTPIAGFPAAFEAPSAGFALDWRALADLRERGVAFATVTHAAGISSTGDARLDRRLPLDEPYRIPATTARAIARAHERGGRVIAIGTTVVRALESAAARDGRVRAGEAIATMRVGAHTPLRIVDAILSGTHEPGTSHYELLRAFADDATLRRADAELEGQAYRTHEFGDSVFVERATCRARDLFRGPGALMGPVRFQNRCGAAIVHARSRHFA
ncbi:MAG TPA: S-adenosylmethionine:tRNA ribosyltransferase-isomerase [Usitatibacter sp.]|nr:S-adenosylmethionine:tRNA ribosyltransferase-isomerase [Usitatibacter sp.]